MDIAILVICILAITWLILPIVNFIKTLNLQKEIGLLRDIINDLQYETIEKKIGKQKENAAEKVVEKTAAAIEPPEPKKADNKSIKLEPPGASGHKQKINMPTFEMQFGAKLPVWIGAIAIILSIFFFIKYSIEQELISPAIRCILGTIVGFALLWGAQWIRKKPSIANEIRIAQALSGSAIAILYIATYAASSLYELIPPIIGFSGMAIVTALAIVAAIRHGVPIALLGLIGGFLTPILISTGNHSAPLLFTYLYLVYAGLMFSINRQHWWKLSIPTLAIALLWVIGWMFSYFRPEDAFWIALFIVAVISTLVFATKKRFSEEQQIKDKKFRPTSVLNYIGLSVALIIMGFVIAEAGFTIMQWALFGLLAIGAIALAYFNEKLYGFTPWISMVVNAVLLYAWQNPDERVFAIILVIFAIIYGGSAYLYIWYRRNALLWSSLVATTTIGYYLLGYYKLHNAEFIQAIPLIWGVVALTFAILAVRLTKEMYYAFALDKHQDYLIAIFAIMATTFISLGLTIEIEKEFLSVVFSTEILALAWINSRVPLKILRPLSAAVAVAFAILLLPQIMLLIQLSVYSLLEIQLKIQDAVPIMEWPVFQLGAPAIMFLGAAILFKDEHDGKLIKIYEVASVILLALMGYYLTRHAFKVDEGILFKTATFIERGAITNVLFIYSLLCIWLGKHFNRTAIRWSGLALSAVALFRIGYFDLLVKNPLWAEQSVGQIAVFNGLILPYGLPLIYTFILAKELQHLNLTKCRKVVNISMFILLFALITLNIRHVFHGEYLNYGPTTNIEIYTYSFIWLLFGVSLLVQGIRMHSKELRYASLVVLLLTIGKVFLYDASELEGLYRVFSFFCLGLSLLAISYVYTRFVFRLKHHVKSS